MGRIRRFIVVTCLAVAVCIATMGAGCFGQEMESQRPAASGTITSSPSGAASSATTPTGPAEKVLEVGNVYGITAGAKAPRFTLKRAATLVQLLTYHYVAGGGPAPGTIGLKAADSTIVGPFQATGADAQGGVKNGFWIATMNAHLAPGTYTVVDSNPHTWSTNSRAKGLGFTTITVIYDK